MKGMGNVLGPPLLYRMQLLKKAAGLKLNVLVVVCPDPLFLFHESLSI